jgi:hypothetical protein
LKKTTIPIKIGDKVHYGTAWVEEEYQCDSCDMHFHSKEQYQKHKEKEAREKRMDEAFNKLLEEDRKWSLSINEMLKHRQQKFEENMKKKRRSKNNNGKTSSS